MKLLPRGTRRRAVAEAVDRWLGWFFFGEPRTLSTLCGERLKAGTANCACKGMCATLDLLEQDHCLRNAGKR